MQVLLQNAALHFKYVFGLTATRPEIHYLGSFSFGRHTADYNDLALSPEEEEVAFSSLEHCATYLSAVQVHTVLESIHPDPFHIADEEVAAAFQISRLIRNAFAHNPFDPRWEIRETWKGRVFTVPDAISLDTTDLDQKRVQRRDYGGPLAILRLIEFAQTIVELRLKEADELARSNQR